MAENTLIRWQTCQACNNRLPAADYPLPSAPGKLCRLCAKREYLRQHPAPERVAAATLASSRPPLHTCREPTQAERIAAITVEGHVVEFEATHATAAARPIGSLRCVRVTAGLHREPLQWQPFNTDGVAVAQPNASFAIALYNLKAYAGIVV